uniref:Metalloendopeptidase n=1 Tax=Parastrongyloides trichosuri TaxID=131310 RepID=A0A0N5A149_PARTI
MNLLFTLIIIASLSNSFVKATKNKYRSKRAVLFNVVPDWKFPINYSIHSQLDATPITEAIAEIESQSCVNFSKVDSTEGSGIEFVTSNHCYVSIPKTNATTLRLIGLNSNCVSKGVVMREVLKALGLINEENRPDRNNYVEIRKNNIKESLRNGFTERTSSEVNITGLRYDPGSLMHHGRYFASSNGKMTIVTKNANYLTTIGQTSEIGFNDMKSLNGKYCSTTCTNQLNCYHYGYPDPKNCTICRCPRFYTGSLCRQLESSPSSCGTTDYTATTTEQSVRVEGIKSCLYRFAAATAGKKVYIKIVRANLPVRTICPPGVGIEVKFLLDKSVSGATLCGSRASMKLKSVGRSLALKYNGLTASNHATISYKEV